MQTQEHGNAGDFRMIPLAHIIPSTTNPRGQFDAESVAGLAASIKRHGVLQSILVRPMTVPGVPGELFEIVAGERRFRAAKLAGLTEIPARVEALGDGEALEVQIVENLQRKDVHPLDEAQGFYHLKEAAGLDIAGIAERVAKDARYIARRLALVNLIEEARDDFRKDSITLAHALEICRLAPDVQVEALAACYERQTVWNKRDDTYTYAPDKERPARHVRHLQEWLRVNVHLNLLKAPFKTDDTRLREDGLACLVCPQRTGFNTGLFDDITNADTCLNASCYKGKVVALVRITKAELDAKGVSPAALISPFYDPLRESKEVLTVSDYQLIERKADRCEYAERAVYAEGEGVGQVKWICREATCKDHLGRARETYARLVAGVGGSSATSPESRNKRRQELFDIRVDEVVRKRVMAESIKTYKFPFERAHLNEVAKEFFRRIPSDDQRTILEVFGWNEKETASLRMNGDKVLRELTKLDNKQIAQFMMLCSFAHYGANHYRNTRVNQEQVEKLAKERDVNHKLIDARARLELVPKKYRARHQVYLDAVTRGAAAKKPVVYEEPPQPAGGQGEPGKEAAPAPPARGTSRAEKGTEKRPTKTSRSWRGSVPKQSAAKAGAAKRKAA